GAGSRAPARPLATRPGLMPSFAFPVPGPEARWIGAADVSELISGRWRRGRDRVVDGNREASRVPDLSGCHARVQADGADLSAGKVENAERRDQSGGAPPATGPGKGRGGRATDPPAKRPAAGLPEQDPSRP